MRRRSTFTPISEIVESIKSACVPESTIAMIQMNWAELVGEQLAKRSYPISERAGVLSIRCGSAVMAQEIDLQSELVIARINRHFGHEIVRQIRTDALPIPEEASLFQ